MKKSWKRILAAVLAACMIFGDSSLVYASESSKPIEEVSSEAGDETAIASSEMSEDIVGEAEEAISEKQEEVVLEENPQEEIPVEEEIPVVEEPQETEVPEEQIPDEEILPAETEDVSTDIEEIIIEQSMEAMNSSGNGLLKPFTPITVSGGESGTYFVQDFDVKVDTTDNYYLYVEGTPQLSIGTIQAYGENGQIDYSIKPKACYTFDIDAESINDVVRGYLLSSDKTYRINVQGRVPADTEVRFYLGKSDIEPRELIAGSAKGEVVPSNSRAMFKISEATTKAGFLQLNNGKNTDMRIYSFANTFQYSCVPNERGMIATIAAGGEEYYIAVQAGSDQDATLFWNYAESEPIAVGDKKVIEKNKEYVYRFYEFVPNEENDYLISAYPNPNYANNYSSGYCYCWTNAVDNDGNVRAFHSSYLGKDYTTKYYGEDYTDESTNVYWRRYQYPEKCEKIYILAWAYPGANTEVSLKEIYHAPTLKAETQVTIEGKDTAYEYDKQYDFIASEDGCYYLKSDVFFVDDILVLNEETGEYEKANVDISYALKYGATDVTDVIKCFNLKAGKTYRVRIKGTVPQEGASFTWTDNEEYVKAKTLELGKTIDTSSTEIFEISSKESILGHLSFADWGFGKIQLYGNSYESLKKNVGVQGSPEARKEFCIAAAGGSKIYAVVKTYTNSKLSWKPLETETIIPDYSYEGVAEQDIVKYYEFTPETEGDYQILAQGGSTKIILIGKDGTIKESQEGIQGEDGNTWIHLLNPETLEKVYIIVEASQGSKIKVIVKDMTKDDDNKLNTFDQYITVPAGETITVTYEGPYLGDFFIEKKDNIDFTAGESDSFIEGPLDYSISGDSYYAYSFTADYDIDTKDTVKFTFSLTNNGTDEEKISIFNSSDYVGGSIYHAGYWIPWPTNIKNERGSYVGYYRFQIDNTTVYRHDGIEWILRESDGKRFDRDNGYGHVVLNEGETYIIKFASEDNSDIGALSMLNSDTADEDKIEYNGKSDECSVYFFKPSKSGKYAGRDQRATVWSRIDETHEWVLMGVGMAGYELEADHTYVVLFRSQDVFYVKNDITILDYDYYQALIQSGGSVTIERGDVKIVPGMDNFTFLDKVLSIFGLCSYENKYKDTFTKGNIYWSSEEGAFAASEYYKIVEDENGQRLVSCEEESVSDGDIVVVRYKPEIIWVDSMTATADRKVISVGEEANISVDAKAATEKYKLENPVFSYESSNPNVLTVNENGVVTAHKDGTATVTVEADVALRYAENCPEKIVKQQIQFTVSKKYQIHYENVSGIEGSLNPENPTEYYTSASTMLTAPTANEGYEFAGWYSDAKLTKKITSIAKGSTGNKTIYAKWDYKDYNIHYVLNGGQFEENYPMTFTVKGGTDLVNPIRHGYKFMGWYTSELFEENTKVEAIASGKTEDLTLYAKWKWATEFSLKVNAEDGVYTFPYNTATGAWDSVPISLSVESNPKGILIDNDSTLKIKLYKGEELIKTLDNTLELSSTDFKGPGDYRLKGTYTHPGQEPQELIGTEFTIKFAKREYPVNKEITWSALSNVESGLNFGDIKDELAKLMQPTSAEAFKQDLGENSLEPVQVTIRNAKKAIVKDTAKLASGTYTVTLDFGENKRFLNEATATLKLSYGAITNAGVHYAALNGKETDEAGRKAGTTIAFEVQNGEDPINTTPYTSDVIITPMLNTPWGVVPADKLEAVLNENGYSGYTVEVNATETASRSELLNVESVKDGETVLAKIKLTAAEQVAGRCNLTVTTTIKNGEKDVATINSVINNFTVVNGGAEAANKITLDLYRAEKNESGQEIYSKVSEYQVGENPAEDQVKTYLIEMTDTARKYKVDWTAYNYAEEEFDASLTWKSGNSKLASVKAEKDGTVFLTVPKNAQGVVEITATAKDAGKKSQSIKLVIVDTSMRLDTTSLTMNSLKNGESATAYLYPNVLASDLEETSIEDLFKKDTVKIYEKVKVGKEYIYNESNIFDSEYNVENGELTVSFKGAQKKASTYTVYVGIKHDDGREEYHTLKIKDTCALPKEPSLKVTKSYETTYVDGYAELELVTYGTVGYVTDDVPAIQTTEDQKFEVFECNQDPGFEGRWILKVRAKEAFADDILPTGKQTSKTTTDVKFVIGYEEYRTGHTVSADITATKILPKLAVYGADSYSPVYYTDAGYRYVDVVIPVTDGMIADSIEDGAVLATDGNSAYRQLTENEVSLKVTLKDTDKFTISSAKYIAYYGSVPAKKGFTTVENAICLTVKVKDSQTKAVSLQFEVESANLKDKIITGKLTINPRKIAVESITLVNNNATVKSLTFNGALAGKESITLKAAMPKTMETLSEKNDVQSRILVEGSDSNGKKMLQSNALLIDIDNDNDAFTITSTDKSFKYTSCKLKVTMQTVTETVNTKSTTLSLSFKKTLTPKITLSNVTLYRGLFKFFDEQEYRTNYWPLGATVKAKITNMPVGAEIIRVRFSDPADNAKYYEPFFYGTSGTFDLEQRNDVKLPLGKDTIGVVYDIRTASGTVISVNSSFTVTVADKLSITTDVKSMNLYNSAVGEQYGKDVTFYEGKTGFAVKVLDITNKEELEKAGISFNLDVTSESEDRGQDTVRFYVDGNLTRGTEKIYTVKAKVALVDSVANDGENDTWNESTATEKIVTFRIVLKK